MEGNNTVSDFLNYLKFEKHFSEHYARPTSCYRQTRTLNLKAVICRVD